MSLLLYLTMAFRNTPSSWISGYKLCQNYDVIVDTYILYEFLMKYWSAKALTVHITFNKQVVYDINWESSPEPPQALFWQTKSSPIT